MDAALYSSEGDEEAVEGELSEQGRLNREAEIKDFCVLQEPESEAED